MSSKHGCPARLLERYMKTRDRVHLYAALGAIAGIAGHPAWHRLQHYFPVEKEGGE